MKCDELIEKIKQAYDDYRHKFIPINLDITIVDLLGAFAELKATAYTDSVDAGMCERKLKRALWLARAEWARSSALSYHLIESHPDKDVAATYKRKANKWEKVKDKCLKKAEEYK